MSILTFGEALLSTGDLDPVYLAIQNAQLEEPELHRLCLAYWCFYSLGTAAYIAHHGTAPRKFWNLMMTAAENEVFFRDLPTYGKAEKPWPRGAERRHFRGANAIKPMVYLRDTYRDATAAIEGFIGKSDWGDPTFKQVASRVERHPGFGPWMSFKIADMSERVLGYHTDFSNCELGIYKDPRQGAAVGLVELDLDHDGNLTEWAKRPWEYPISDAQLKTVVAHYVKAFKKFSPPGGGRKVNVQEVETIFCKYKSHLKGHYPLGKDTREVHHGLQGWGPLAERLDKALIASTS